MIVRVLHLARQPSLLLQRLGSCNGSSGSSQLAVLLFFAFILPHALLLFAQAALFIVRRRSREGAQWQESAHQEPAGSVVDTRNGPTCRRVTGTIDTSIDTLKAVRGLTPRSMSLPASAVTA